ncbi:MAG: transcriptional repressor [Deltaproteobacteria bacterium]|nr:transcriptional repressor [Deltaproteobacteria bacterium]
MKELIQKYRGKGLKLTPQRLAILKFLEGNTNHPTAEDIFRQIKKTYPTVSFATVYNTLEILKKKGEILEITIDWDRRHYDPNTTMHHHIICVKCKTIGDVFEDYSEALLLPKYIVDEFKPVGNHIGFYGVCKKCRRKGG